MAVGTVNIHSFEHKCSKKFHLPACATAVSRKRTRAALSDALCAALIALTALTQNVQPIRICTPSQHIAAYLQDASIYRYTGSASASHAG